MKCRPFAYSSYANNELIVKYHSSFLLLITSQIVLQELQVHYWSSSLEENVLERSKIYADDRKKYCSALCIELGSSGV